MGLFRRDKCPIHRIEYSIGKNYMCQPFYYCKKCKYEKNRLIELEKKVEKHIANIGKE